MNKATSMNSTDSTQTITKTKTKTSNATTITTTTITMPTSSPGNKMNQQSTPHKISKISVNLYSSENYCQ